MQSDWLDTFLAVVDHGGFSAASEALYRSQSRVSAHVASLERELGGVALFDRTQRPVALTRAGKIFLESARQLVDTLAATRVEIASAVCTSEYRVTFGLATGLAAGFASTLLAAAQRHPGLQVGLVELDVAELDEAVREGRIAVALRPLRGTQGHAELLAQPLWREALWVLLHPTHALAAADRLAPADLGDEPLVVCRSLADEPGVRSLHAVHRDLPVLAAEELHTAVTLVRAGFGVGVVAESSLAGLGLDGVAPVRLDAPRMTRDVALVHSPLAMTPGTGALRGLLTPLPVPAGCLDLRNAPPGGWGDSAEGREGLPQPARTSAA